MASIDLVSVTKRYGDDYACSDINLSIADGEFVTLLGPSGCGKSTTLNMVAGLDDVTSGTIYMDSVPVNDLIPFERDIAMVFQSYGLYPHMTVGQNIGFTLKLRKLPKSEIREKVQRVAESLELGHLLHRLPRDLSGGQQQRVALGRAVIREPRAFLFDEPFSNLDASLRQKMRVEVKRLHERLNITSLFVTHDQEEALSMSDRVAVMGAGRVEQFGTPDEVYNEPVNKYVARFIGSPQMDILEGQLERNETGVSYRVGAADFDVPERLAGRLTGEVDLGIRPEYVLFGGDGAAAVVIVSQPLGPYTDVTVGWDGGELTARVPGIANYPTGSSVSVRLDPAGLTWFDRTSGDRIPGD